jgi:probable rRNA maturation factor
MTIQIDVRADPVFREWKPAVQRACSKVLEQLDVGEGSLTVVLTDEQTIHQMNLDFAGDDQATDVLSFPAGDLDPESGIVYFGDILIAVPIAQKHSDAKGHNLGDELSLLAIHGTLHLLGHNHADAESRDQMWSLQSRALQSLGIEDISEDKS